MSILDKVTLKSGFIPSTINEYVALALAKYLSETNDIQWYVSCLERFGPEDVFRQFGKSIRAGPEHAQRRLRASLDH
jgi:hypothetical protein